MKRISTNSVWREHEARKVISFRVLVGNSGCSMLGFSASAPWIETWLIEKPVPCFPPVLGASRPGLFAAFAQVNPAQAAAAVEPQTLPQSQAALERLE